VNYIRHLIARSSEKYGVAFRFAEAVEAFNAVHPESISAPLKLNVSLKRNAAGYPSRADVVTVSGKIFGPQPFLAIRTRSRRYIHDNFNLGNEPGSFNYAFDEHSILPEDVSAIGVAANDAAGHQYIYTTAD
jgi:hypothetical protein